MRDESQHNAIGEPFEILGLKNHATEDEIRARYLELVKQFPPEREPETFRRIQAAYQAVRNPLKLATSMLKIVNLEQLPTWQEVIDDHQHRPPAMAPSFVLSLGNQTQSPHSSKQTKSSADDQQSVLEQSSRSMNEDNGGDVNG